MHILNLLDNILWALLDQMRGVPINQIARVVDHALE